ncbi:hypothetical protein MYX76_18130, partial [Desulfobacterota bacterium AH_259_B03_O07]|nr:hypothetical protein [Desulfobacterota bacterium AH_259_B03_O07]
LEPLSMKRKKYKVNPKKDMRPVCPNCHAIIHRRDPPYTINDAKKMIQNKTIKKSKSKKPARSFLSFLRR